MHVDFLLEAFRRAGARDALVGRGPAVSHAALADEVGRWGDRLAAAGVSPGAVVSLEGDFSPPAVAALLALAARGGVVVPLATDTGARRDRLLETAQVETRIALGADGRAEIDATGRRADHPHYATLRAREHPGLVLFSSGSTGEAKAAVHDLTGLLAKFRTPRPARRIVAFLMFDHIGGLNTLLATLSSGGCLVTLDERAPDAVCAAIARWRAEVLPTSPTFLNLLLVSGAWRRHDLSSLRLVTYGTEVMPESTLTRLREALPDVELKQTYGLSELGILRSRSRSSDSLWVKVGGEGYETRVVDGKLEIKAASAMLGYLNAPSPFTPDGWFRTGDFVEREGEYLRIRGRASELINVGGEKVHPAEVESVVQLMGGVEDVAVHGEAHPLTGHVVVARVKLSTGESRAEFARRMRDFCRERLGPSRTPHKVELTARPSYEARFKRMRGGQVQ